jgi:hypothetical protein
VRLSFRMIIAVVTVTTAVTSACSGQAAPVGNPPTPVPSTAVSVPGFAVAEAFPAGAAADYQLGGPYPPPGDVRVVVRDSTAPPAPGVYNICYVNGFQTQPADRGRWLRERGDLVLFGQDGRPLVDENWPDELIVDTSTADQRTRLAGVVGQTIRTCATAGFNAVEIDNLDSYRRARGVLTVEDNLAFAAEPGRIAHDAGLIIGQKNAAEFGERGRREAAFDFAVAEECLRFAECAAYTAIYGDRVVDIEYTDNLGGPLDRVCAQPDRPKSTIVRDRKLVAQGSEGYFYQHC